MTIWKPRLGQSSAPIYQRIADRIETDVGTGLLLPGSRLPTQRDLASHLGVTVVTVTRAYREAARRGLLSSTVGRGTFVRDSGTSAIEGRIDLATNVIHGGELTLGRELAQRIAASLETSYGRAAGSERHRAAGATWIQRVRPDASASRVVVTCGAQQAMFAALSACTRPGDSVLCEEVVYQGLHAVAAVLHLKLEPLPMDRFGVIPDALARAAKKRNARVAYLTPTLQNPTGSVMPEKRRRDIASVATKLNITVIEDDVYGFFATNAPPPITSLLPDRSIYLTGLGKSVAASVRVGYTLANDELTARIAAAVSATTLFAPLVIAEIAATWIEDGTAMRILAAKRETIAMRRRIAQRVIDRKIASDVQSPHLWIDLPPRRDANELAQQARARGVKIAEASRFAVGTSAPNAVRLSIGAPSSAAELETALRVVADLLARAPRSDESITV